tara:strand:+ start:3248 stop:3484 length:237 start_codon:yes stop_codon:yes gene_type:complete
MDKVQDAGAMKEAGLQALSSVQETLKNLMHKVGGAKKRLRRKKTRKHRKSKKGGKRKSRHRRKSRKSHKKKSKRRRRK